MSVAYLILHIITFVLLVIICHRVYRVILMGHHNWKNDAICTSDKIHVLDHLIGVLMLFIGTSVAASMTGVEVIGLLSGVHIDLEIPTNSAFIFMLIGICYVVWHLEKEETPTHPFYHCHKRTDLSSDSETESYN